MKTKNDLSQASGYSSIQASKSNLTQAGGDYSTQTGGYSSTQTAGRNSTQTGGDYSTQEALSNSTQIAGHNSKQITWGDSIQIAGYSSIQETRSSSTQKALGDSIQKAWDNSIQKAGSNSIQETGSNSTCISECLTKVIASGKNIVARRVDIPQVILLNNQTIMWCPKDIAGYIELIKNKWYLNGDINSGEHIIADGILSKIVKQKGDVYHVINHGDDKVTYLVHKNGFYAHGDTLSEAKDSLQYKIVSRDLSEYKDYSLDTVLSSEDAIIMYRSITGACEYGVRSFLDKKNISKRELTINEVIDITKGEYGNDVLVDFF